VETKRTITVAAALAIAVSFSLTSLSAHEVGNVHIWPEHHGPGRKNISPDRGLLKKWPEGGPPRLWTYSKCGKGYSGVTIAEGMIFTAGDFGREQKLLAIDMDGNLLWEARNGDAWRGASPGSRSTPTYSEGALYHMNPTGRLAAYEAKSGRPLWDVDLKSRFDARWGIWALSENVVVEGDRVLCMPGGPEGRVVALDKRTGKTIWTNTDIEHSAAYCSGIVVNHDGVRQLITMTQRSVVGVDVLTGELVWSAPFVPRSPQNALTPVYHDGHVFVACGHSSDGTLMKIDQASRTAAVVWQRSDLDDCHSGALLVNGRLYGTSCRQGGKSFYCVDYLTGKTIKTDDTLGKVGITYADGMIYALNYRGTVYLIEINDEGFEIASSFELKRRPANTYLAHPVVCGGRLYLRGAGELHAYDIRAD
jgi:outer membrane protein assembly factor BamB